ncbi:MAG: hypothetical protein GY828_03930, partial [Candidatus Gracilibacteria bacterium]|nr:hypothetical protein [Candidatus Gracilibacteria bacterium]
VMQEKHFDTQFFTFINYFQTNYNLLNFNTLDEIYKDKSYLLSTQEQEIVLNTVYHYIAKPIDSWDITEFFDSKIIRYLDKPINHKIEKYIAKIQYIQSLSLHRIEKNNYNSLIGFDNEIKNDFEILMKEIKIKNNSIDYN